MRFGRFLSKDIVAGIVLILFSLWVIWEAREFAAAAARFRGISPALFPTILAVAIILLACVMIVRGLRRGRNWEFTFDLRRKNSHLALGLVAGTALYGLTLDFLGFLLATTVYALVFIVWMKGGCQFRVRIRLIVEPSISVEDRYEPIGLRCRSRFHQMTVREEQLSAAIVRVNRNHPIDAI